MADASTPVAEPTKEKKEKKKKDKTGDEEKPRKSSMKKASLEAPKEDVSLVSENEVTQPTPKVEEEPAPEPTPTVAEPVSSHEEEAPKPRRKPSKRSLELEIDEEKLNQLKEAFQIFDFNHDGVIDKDDLRKSLIALGQDIHDIQDFELDKMMSEACQPLDFDAFIMLLGYRTIELDAEEVLRDALSRWDNEGTGFISEEKFRFDLMHLGDKFTEKEADMALEDAPVKKGKEEDAGFVRTIRMINYPKFCHVLCGLRKKTKDPSLEEFGLDVSA